MSWSAARRFFLSRRSSEFGMVAKWVGTKSLGTTALGGFPPSEWAYGNGSNRRKRTFPIAKDGVAVGGKQPLSGSNKWARSEKSGRRCICLNSIDLATAKPPPRG